MNITEANTIRDHVVRTRIQPVKRLGLPRPYAVQVRSIEVAKELGLEHNMPNVCGALDRKKFREENNVQIKSRTGPKAGRTVVWTFLV